MADSIKSMPYKYRVGKSINLRAVGRWQHGAGLLQIFLDQEPVASVDLPSAEWTLLAVLSKAALRSAADGWPYAFVDSETLAAALEELAGLGRGEVTSLHRVIYRLRRLLSERVSQPLSKKRWGTDLIEMRPALGYRLSIWPGQLQLTLLDEPRPDVSGRAEME